MDKGEGDLRATPLTEHVMVDRMRKMKVSICKKVCSVRATSAMNLIAKRKKKETVGVIDTHTDDYLNRQRFKQWN